MKPLHDRTLNLEAQSVLSDLPVRVALLFEQSPILCGFSVQEQSRLTAEHRVIELREGLCLADVTVNTRSSPHVIRAMCNEIACALVELLHEHPEVLELLRGRTFARTFH